MRVILNRSLLVLCLVGSTWGCAPGSTDWSAQLDRNGTAELGNLQVQRHGDRIVLASSPSLGAWAFAAFSVALTMLVAFEVAFGTRGRERWHFALGGGVWSVLLLYLSFFVLGVQREASFDPSLGNLTFANRSCFGLVAWSAGQVRFEHVRTLRWERALRKSMSSHALVLTRDDGTEATIVTCERWLVSADDASLRSLQAYLEARFLQ